MFSLGLLIYRTPNCRTGDYGNKLGLPTVNGSVLYDVRMSVTLGVLRCTRHSSARFAPTEPRAGDRIISLVVELGRGGPWGHLLVGGHGCVDRGPCRVRSPDGDPITEKGLIESERRMQLYNAITDWAPAPLLPRLARWAKTSA